MAIKTTLNYSYSFNPIKRKANSIKFIIFFFFLMKKESAAINKLTNIQSEVSSHYVIKNSGEIVLLVPDLYIAWHAGKSSWKNYKSLNKNSIGIEVSNPGHQHIYKNFSNKQIISILKLSNFLLKKYKIDPKNVLGHSDISPDRKKDPGEKFPWKFLAKNKISLWHTLKDQTLKDNREVKIDDTSKEFFLKNLFKIGYPKKIPKNLKKNIYITFIIKAFQRKYRQELINGKIDKECLLISENILKKFY